jgi:hypothetical protein
LQLLLDLIRYHIELELFQMSQADWCCCRLIATAVKCLIAWQPTKPDFPTCVKLCSEIESRVQWRSQVGENDPYVSLDFSQAAPSTLIPYSFLAQNFGASLVLPPKFRWARFVLRKNQLATLRSAPRAHKDAERVVDFRFKMPSLSDSDDESKKPQLLANLMPNGKRPRKV